MKRFPSPIVLPRRPSQPRRMQKKLPEGDRYLGVVHRQEAAEVGGKAARVPEIRDGKALALHRRKAGQCCNVAGKRIKVPGRKDRLLAPHGGSIIPQMS